MTNFLLREIAQRITNAQNSLFRRGQTEFCLQHNNRLMENINRSGALPICRLLARLCGYAEKGDSESKHDNVTSRILFIPPPLKRKIIVIFQYAQRMADLCFLSIDQLDSSATVLKKTTMHNIT